MNLRSIPSAEAEPDRYIGKPLLIFIENYVLDSIGHLEPEKSHLVAKMIQRVFGGGDDWKETLRGELDWGPGVDDEFRRLWVSNQEIARVSGVSLHPIQFAKMIADNNFRDNLEPPTQ